MSQLSFFDRDDDEEAAPQAARLAPKLRRLAAEGIHFGTSSWKYEGWLGSIYSPDRYASRGKFSRKKFEDTCLVEYARTFPVVCGDFAFYQFPSPAYWERLLRSVKPPFLFAFKVPENVTVARWPGHARYGERAGEYNPEFLDAALLRNLFTRRLEPYADRVAVLILEFGTFTKSAFPTPDDFLARLVPFLEKLPEQFRFAIEVRNPEYLGTGYFTLLASHGVAHVLSAWTRTPELADQAALPGVFGADFTVVRALLRKGRTYEQAVSSFEPYRLVQDANEPARDALRSIAEGTRRRKKPAFLFVNNRLEGNAPSTIEAVVDRL
jgi:uncharacterized protein YecE (DUF72 family)